MTDLSIQQTYRGTCGAATRTEESISAGEELVDTALEIFNCGLENLQRAPKYEKFLP